MRTYARVHPVNYNYKQALKRKLNFKKVIPNSAAAQYLRLVRLGKMPFKRKGLLSSKMIPITYKEWMKNGINDKAKHI